MSKRSLTKPATSTTTIDGLKVHALQALYQTAIGTATTSRNRPWLIKKIIVAQTAAQAAKPKKVTKPKNADQPAHSGGTARDPGLTPGTVLRRDWKGTPLVLTVLDQGFDLNGVAYRSLSAAATAITGGNRNGHTFFGLTKQATA